MNPVAVVVSLHDALERAEPEREARREALDLLLDRFSALVTGQGEAVEEELFTVLYKSIERLKRDGPAGLALQLAEEVRALLPLR